VPPQIKRIILELGLRYRPASPDQLEAHQAKLAALMMDLADIPPAPLEAAVRRWVLESPYLPKASDLVSLVQQRAPQAGAIDWIARGNAHLRELGRTDIHWIRDGNGDLKLESVS
jgi:hypothetical protein